MKKSKPNEEIALQNSFRALAISETLKEILITDDKKELFDTLYLKHAKKLAFQFNQVFGLDKIPPETFLSPGTPSEDGN